MSLIINQGKQDTSNDKNFDVMVSANEVAQIIKIEMDKEWENTLNITFKIIGDGKYKGRQFWDRVSFDPKSNFSWKYRNLRKSAGVPYAEGESPKIDIEALLLNKAVTVELLVRKGNDGNDYQSVKYKNATTQSVSTPVANTTVEESTEDVFDSTDDYDESTSDEVIW